MKRIVDCLLITLGLAMIAYAISVLIVPNKIIQGGVSGISAILFYMLNIPVSVSNFVINIVLILLGIKILGKRFIINTLVCVFVLSLFIELFSRVEPITDDKILSSVFGAVLYGIGAGLTFLKGSSSGGTDIMGRIIQHFIPHLPIGTILLFIDGAIIAIGYVVLRDLELVMYGLLTVIITAFAIDYFIRKLNISKIAFIITDKGDEIAEKLIASIGRGITKINVVGAYTNDSKYMLMCAVKEREMCELQKKIESIDKEAFTIFSESQQIVGNGFRVYR